MGTHSPDSTLSRNKIYYEPSILKIQLLIVGVRSSTKTYPGIKIQAA
jgi:hypothetical protein